MIGTISKNKQTGAFVERNVKFLYSINQASILLQFQKGDALKNVGVVKLNLGECVDSAEPIIKRMKFDKLKPEYEGYIEFQLKST